MKKQVLLICTAQTTMSKMGLWQNTLKTLIWLEREDLLAKLQHCSKGNFLDSCSNCAKGLPQGLLYSKIVQRQGCQVPIAPLISLCKCVTSEKALIYLNAYAIRPPFPLLKASSLIYIITEPIQKPHNISSSSLRLAYISIWLICLDLLYLSCIDALLGNRRRVFKQMSSSKNIKKNCHVVCSICINSNSWPLLNHSHLLISP